MGDEEIGETAKSAFLNAELNEQAKEAEAEMLRSQFQPGNMVESAIEADISRG